MQIAILGNNRAVVFHAPTPDKNLYSPDVELIYREMSTLREICHNNKMDLICEFIPGLDLFNAARFEDGIFRFGLPAVYQMAFAFKTEGERVSWQSSASFCGTASEP